MTNKELESAILSTLVVKPAGDYDLIKTIESAGVSFDQAGSRLGDLSYQSETRRAVVVMAFGRRYRDILIVRDA